MNKQQPQPFSIKCQCSAYRYGLQITAKRKSKLSNLVLDPKAKNIRVMPLNSKEQNCVFQLKRLKNIYRTYLMEGKITLQFAEQKQKSKDTIRTIEAQNNPERLSRILVESASPQNLELFIKKIVHLKNQMKKLTLKKQPDVNTQTMDQAKDTKSSLLIKKKQNYPKFFNFQNNKSQKKKDSLKQNQSTKEDLETDKNQAKINRRQLMKQAYGGINTEQKKLPEIQPIFKLQINILELPSILLENIFKYTNVELRHRLISQKFNRFALRNIRSLSFRDQVDQETFNKLAKYVPNIYGRLKNVRNLELIDTDNKLQLQKNRAKSLHFGDWKEMSKKNIMQIKGLKLYLLEMPFQIKFDFQCIYGIQLRELHLVSKSELSTGNCFITDENIIYLFKNVKQLESFSIPFLNSSVLDELTTNLKQKTKMIRSLRIGSINQNCKKEEKWFLFHYFEQLRVLTVQKVLKGGLIKNETRYSFTFPLYLEQLEIGSVLSEEIIYNLPTTLNYLKLLGDQYKNSEVSKIYLPYLKYFDVSECPLVRPSVINELDKCNNLKMITNWQKQDYDYWKVMAQQKCIQIMSLKWMIIKR